ncbi:N-acyl-D-amino-acid deacylase [Sporosarcina sp. NCCP-2716]|uniref:amidohydrolase family protein n=1 Tax=Sporosarcina sp. NCCP-2716 TaxID=2943679 RepID=UPI002041BBF9|nr:amidohydrolase family protein [Sporosarcina sp. NCCP-2716]GKV70065.1 N-acyl-D-amino-acid deacylase [Sporosarcina sp. NCCP-2716]
MTETLLVKNARISDEGALQDLFIKDGLFEKIGPQLEMDEQADRVIDCRGKVVLPGLIESHIHPDKAFLEDRKPNVSGTLDEAIRNTGELKKAYTYDDVYNRAEKVLNWAISKGTTIMRAHPDVDHIEELLGVEVLLELKEKYRDKIDLQIVVFPQEGILKSEGTLDRLEEGLKMGADVVGGCPYNEKSIEDSYRHLEYVFDLAEKYDVPVDMHVDFADHTDDPRYMLTERICKMTIERGWQGRVALGHVTTLGSMETEEAGQLFDKIAETGITIMPLPATDVYLNGRDDTHNVRRGMAPVKRLLEHGVNVVFASNNIRNAFTPFGNANLLLVGYLLAETQYMGSADEQRKVLDMITVNAAKCLGIEETYGLEEGKQADLVVLDSEKLSEVIQDQPIANVVVKRGQVIVEQQILPQ